MQDLENQFSPGDTGILLSLPDNKIVQQKLSIGSEYQIVAIHYNGVDVVVGEDTHRFMHTRFSKVAK